MGLNTIIGTPAGRPGRPEGGSMQEKVSNEARKPININPEYVPLTVRYQPMPGSVKRFRCCMCGNEWSTQRGNFLTSSKSPLWRANGGFLPFCKACCESMMENLVAFYGGNEEHALKHLCQIFDWYYDEAASAMTLTQVQSGKCRLNLYPSKACTRQVAERGETFLDTVKDDFKKSQRIDDFDTAQPEESSEDDEFIVTREMIRAWGVGFTPSEYRYLEEEYADWISKNVCNTKSQEELYHNIVLAQLDIRRARQRGGKVAEAQKALQDLMNSANILPRQTADNIIADTQTFGTLLKKYEETDPIPEPDERWKDVDGIRKYVNTWFRGGLAKAVKINGIENVKLYDEAIAEMEKYTVYPPDKSSPANIENKTAIFDVKEQGDNEQQ